MDRAKAQRALEAINLAATGDNNELMQLIAQARGELMDAGWHGDMAPAAGLAGIGVAKVAASEPEAEPPAVPAEPPAAEPAHRTLHVDVDLEGEKVVGAHSVP